ncbi:MAG: cob(I)yrinic acid a,c-diamide adenosyltransferase [Eubacterium sp.]|nr:cob(I)yrinic acid a,c-diamide adenosyltransferase [Eubacterium sp.]
MIHIYEGDGKGKTTAAVGLSIRCAGSGHKVFFAQFLKGNESNEIKLLKAIDNITVYEHTKEFGFTFAMQDEETRNAKKYYRDEFHKVIHYAKKSGAELLILDEILDCCYLDMVDEDELLHFLMTRPKEMEVVLTGRNPSDRMMEITDYHTHFQKIKHPFDRGVVARYGIEM